MRNVLDGKGTRDGMPMFGCSAMRRRPPVMNALLQTLIFDYNHEYTVLDTLS